MTYTIPVTFQFDPNATTLTAEQVRQKCEDEMDRKLGLMMVEVDNSEDQKMTIEERNKYYQSQLHHAH